MVLTRIKFPPLNISWSNYEGFLFTSCQAFCVCLYMCFCVSGSLIGWISFSLPLSALVSPVPDPEEALAGIWKHTRAHTKNTHTHTDQCLGSPIEIRSLSKGLYPGIPDITERQKICMKRETPYRALSVCVCACAGVFVQTQHHGTLNGNQLLVSLAHSLTDPNSGEGLDCCQPVIEHTNESITIHYSYPQSSLECPSLGCVMNGFTPGFCFNCQPVVQKTKRYPQISSKKPGWDIWEAQSECESPPREIKWPDQNQLTVSWLISHPAVMFDLKIKADSTSQVA